MPATVSFVDIAGIVKGASEGEGLGNQFLANIREADAIAQVVRGFDDSDVVHVAGAIDPASDLATITTELALADLQTLEKALPRYQKEVTGKSLDPAVLEAATAAQDWLERRQAALGIRESTSRRSRSSGLMTAKPIIYVFNVDEAVLTSDAKRAELAALVAPADAVFLDAKIESELMDLDAADAAELLASTGQTESGLDQLARIGFDTLGLQTYLTAGPEGIAGLDDPQGRQGSAGGGRHPHRLRARVHQGRDRLVRGSRGDRLDRRGAREGQGPNRGQGLRDARRRRRGVPVQRVGGRMIFRRVWVRARNPARCRGRRHRLRPLRNADHPRDRVHQQGRCGSRLVLGLLPPSRRPRGVHRGDPVADLGRIRSTISLMFACRVGAVDGQAHACSDAHRCEAGREARVADRTASDA